MAEEGKRRDESTWSVTGDGSAVPSSVRSKVSRVSFGELHVVVLRGTPEMFSACAASEQADASDGNKTAVDALVV